MISGTVIDRHVIVPVVFQFDARPNLIIEFVVDTGFTGELCLSEEAVALLGLPFQYDIAANLADDSEILLAVHEATIIWNDQELLVRVLATTRSRPPPRGWRGRATPGRPRGRPVRLHRAVSRGRPGRRHPDRVVRQRVRVASRGRRVPPALLGAGRTPG